MKTKLCVLFFGLTAALALAQTNGLTSLLQQGLFEEQASRNLPAAISNYQTLATQFDQDRQLAATAVFRIGECYRMEGRTNEAAVQYQRILRDFSDQTTLATLSRQNLVGMGVTSLTIIAAESPDAALWNKVKNLDKGELPSMLPTLVSDPVLETLLQQRNEAATKVAQLKVDYAPDSIRVVRQQTVVDEINRQIDQKVVGIMQALRMRSELSSAAGSEASKDATGPSVQTTSDEDQEIQRIQQMIQNSPDLINAPSGSPLQRFTPLGRAASKGQLRVAKFLLANGASINATDDNGQTALNVAVEAGNRAMVEFLLSQGADVNAKSSGTEETPLHTAAKKDFAAVVKVLLANKSDVNAQDNFGNTALRLAALKGGTKITRMLLAASANPNISNKKGQTPLSAVAGSGSLETTKLLLDAGANPNVENDEGRTPLSFAAENGSTEIIKLLLGVKADPNGGKLDAPLLAAIHQNDTNSAELLLQAGANSNAKSYADNNISNRDAYASVTPLWLAVSMKQFPMVQLLLKFKADPNDSQIDGRSILFGVLTETNILEALLDAGAKVDATTKDEANWTPLGAAARDNNAAAVEILLKHGANPNVRNSNGATPLHWAAYRPAGTNVFELLLAAKADPNVRSSNGRTPLDELKESIPKDAGANGTSPGRFSIPLPRGSPLSYQWGTTGQNTPDEKAKLVGELCGLLREHGALDKLPDWDHITVSRPAANFSQTVFQQGTNDWNRFTLLGTMLNFYSASSRPVPMPMNFNLPFPDLAHVVIVRPSHDSTNETRIEVNLLNGTNGIDGAKDVPLQFGDVVEIPERDHALGDSPVGLTGSQQETIANCLRGKVQLVTHGQKVELSIYPTADGSLLESVIQKPEAQKVLLSSSDLSRVKVIRHDAKTGKQQEWVVDCSDQGSSANGNSPISYQWVGDANHSSLATGLWLRDGDVIEVPEKP